MLEHVYALRRNAGNYFSLAMLLTHPTDRAVYLAMAQRSLERANQEIKKVDPLPDKMNRAG
jgi:hypothetical protein